MTLGVLVRKQLRDSRWLLGLSTLAFFAMSWGTVYLAHRFEILKARGELGRDIRRFGFLRGLGGAAMDYSTTALEVCWWNHPFVILIVLGWAVARGSSAIAGEIERGTLDLVLSRPVARSTFLLSQVIASVIGLFALATALILGNVIGTQFNVVESPPSVDVLIKPAVMVFLLGWSIYGYTLPFSAIESNRWRPMVLSIAITLGGLIAMSVAPQFEGLDWLEKLSVFQAYAPVTVALQGDPLLYNSVVLGIVGLVGVVLGFAGLWGRDLPTSS